MPAWSVVIAPGKFFADWLGLGYARLLGGAKPAIGSHVVDSGERVAAFFCTLNKAHCEMRVFSLKLGSCQLQQELTGYKNANYILWSEEEAQNAAADASRKQTRGATLGAK